MSGPVTRDVASWHRRVCPVTDWLLISGDLPPSPHEAVVKLGEWMDAGVTDIVDVRGEWSDEKFVHEQAPQLRYHYLGTHDDGTTQDDAWYLDGLAALKSARRHSGAVVMVHCHMGVNRGPSMAFAFLLDQGWAPVDALNAIRAARPIAGVIYAHDAIRAVGRMQGKDELTLAHEHQSVENWFDENQIDIATIIRRIRSAT